MTTTKKISELPSAVTPLVGDEDIPIVQGGATRRATPDDIRNGLADAVHTHILADIADAGTAAASNVGDFATAAQGALADTALQDAGAFATAAQGAKADTATQPGDLATVATSGDYGDISDIPLHGLENAIINGCGRISHRSDQSLGTSWDKAPIDLLSVKAEGSVSAGTIKRVTSAFTLTETGHATFVENATLTGAGAILFRRRIEAKDAWKLYNQAAYYSARVYHDHGANVDFIITVRKADALDDFTTTTQIATGTVSVANNTNSNIDLAIADMGDCRNGIEIEVKVDCGVITTKDTYLGQEQLSIGTAKRPFMARPVALEEDLVSRYLRPVTGLMAVANSASNMQVVLNHPNMRATPTYEVTAALAFTDGYTADFTQSSANIGTIHENNAHHGRADIALFSGLTSGRFHIQRGTGGIILASAEL